MPIDPASPFQSRNRGSFDFKIFDLDVSDWNPSGFNLVIEVLLISRMDTVSVTMDHNFGFNLVIEVLLISSIDDNHNFHLVFRIVSIS